MNEVIAKDLFYSAYRIAGILTDPDRGYSKGEGNDALRVANSMLDAWKAKRGLVWAILRSTFPLVPNQLIYTIGDSGAADFAIERPEKIEAAGYLYHGEGRELEIPIAVLNDRQWQGESIKDLPGTIATKLYYEPATPNGIIHLLPVPSTSDTLALYLWRTLNKIATPDDPIQLAPNYQEAIEYNLAVRLAARYPERANISQVSMMIAAQSLRTIMAMNAPEPLMRCQSGALGTNRQGGTYNILTNRYN